MLGFDGLVGGSDGNRVKVVFIGLSPRRPRHDAVSDGLPALLVHNPVAEYAIKQRPPFSGWPGRIASHQFDHCVLHDVQSLIRITNCYSGNVKGPAFNLGEKCFH